MANPLPDWAKPGSDVARYYRRNRMDAAVTMTKVERVTATQIVTDDGSRWVDKSPTSEPDIRPLGGDRYRSPQLLPSSDPRVREALVAAALTRAASGVNTAFDAWRRDERNTDLARELAVAAGSYADLLAAKRN